MLLLLLSLLLKRGELRIEDSEEDREELEADFEEQDMKAEMVSQAGKLAMPFDADSVSLVVVLHFAFLAGDSSLVLFDDDDDDDDDIRFSIKNAEAFSESIIFLSTCGCCCC